MNQMASVRLRVRGEEGSARAFTVSCYHMPCLFTNSQFMTLHCALAAQHAHAFAAGSRYILAGDFNIKPSSPQYHLLTRGACSSRGDEPEGQEYPGDSWQARVAPLVSAYAEKLGREPPFTNCAQGAAMAQPFCDTLDYIFLSPGWRTRSVQELPESPSGAGGVCPNKDQPSDHLLLAAHLEQVPVGSQP